MIRKQRFSSAFCVLNIFNEKEMHIFDVFALFLLDICWTEGDMMKQSCYSQSVCDRSCEADGLWLGGL